MTTYISIALISLIVGTVAGWLGFRYLEKYRAGQAKSEADRILGDANQKSKSIMKEAELQAKDDVFQAKMEIEKESKEKRQELQVIEKRLIHKEESLDKKVDLLDSKEADVSRREKKIFSREETVGEMERKLENLIEESRAKLERLAGISGTEAKRQLMDSMVNEARHEAAKKIKQVEEETREESEKVSKKILALSMQRYAGDYVSERTVSVVHLPGDDMKGRIIGREGRNIRAFETVTGINLIIDDTPEAVILSSFDPVRREIARLTLDKLITDGRIHPARIEEIYQKSKVEVDNEIREAGEKAVFETGVHGLHPELVRVLGRLRYRTSYGQNVLQHSIEVAHLAAMMAAELNADEALAKRSGLLHDIGKAIDHEVEGPHAVIGADLAKRLNESPVVCHPIEAHHADVEPKTIEAILVQSADAISASRPGARREMLENYIKRLEKLETLAESYKGVEKSYAMQAGREIRIMVKPGEIDDNEATLLAREIAKDIEEQLQYPGQIKVIVIRENRSIEYAK